MSAEIFTSAVWHATQDLSIGEFPLSKKAIQEIIDYVSKKPWVTWIQDIEKILFFTSSMLMEELENGDFIYPGTIAFMLSYWHSSLWMEIWAEELNIITKVVSEKFTNIQPKGL